MKNKIIIISLLLSLCLGVTSCKSANDSSSRHEEQNKIESVTHADNDDVSSKETWLRKKAQEATDSLFELTQDEVYVKAFTASQDVSDIIESWQGAQADTDEIYVVSISESNAEAFLSSSGDIDYNNLSSAGKRTIYNSMGRAISSQISGRQGVNYIAAVSILNYSISYEAEYDINNQVWFIPTDREGLAACVSFVNSGEDVITVNSSYLYYGDENLNDALDSCLSYIGAEIEVLEKG